MRSEVDFTDKTVVITGSGRGIGRVIAMRFAALHANVVVSDIDQEVVSKVAAEIGDAALGCRADVACVGDVEELFKVVSERFGRIDVLVNNAGITRDGLVIRMDEKDWDIVLDINLKGAFLATRAAARMMIKQRYGRIVNISSVAGLTGNVGQANYSASKAGLIGLTRTVAKELAPRGVTVNAVAPGFIETEMTAALPDAAKEHLLGKVALRRPGSPDDVASAVVFLASDLASYITGQVLPVDGGMLIS